MIPRRIFLKNGGLALLSLDRRIRRAARQLGLSLLPAHAAARV